MAIRRQLSITGDSDEVLAYVCEGGVMLAQADDRIYLKAPEVQDLIDAIRELQDDLP